MTPSRLPARPAIRYAVARTRRLAARSDLGKKGKRMAVAVFMTWPGATAATYDQLRQVARWESEPAPGGLFHVAAFDEHGAHITDLWERAEDFQRFVNERLMPGVAQVGLPGQPQVEVVPAHAIFTPGFTPK